MTVGVQVPLWVPNLKLEPEDYYEEDGKIVLTEHFLRKRGFCCGNICRHCPYGEDIQRAASGQKQKPASSSNG